jgi:hypothetical protein
MEMLLLDEQQWRRIETVRRTEKEKHDMVSWIPFNSLYSKYA